MNTLVEQNVATIMRDDQYFSYILNDSNLFLSTEYKVLQSQGQSNFLKCMKTTFNGKMQFYYLAEDCKPLLSVIHTLDEEQMLCVISNILSAVNEVKQNGFLHIESIDTGFENIYINTSSLECKLVYLPCKTRFSCDSSVFENELRTSLVKLINSREYSSSKILQFVTDLSNGLLGLDDLLKKTKGIKIASKSTGNNSKNMKLVLINSDSKFEICVNKDKFVIGKKEGAADAVITFNKAVSRSHCRINKSEEGYQVEDLQSANGTFVNKTRVSVSNPVQIDDGDILRLANIDFKVVME